MQGLDGTVEVAQQRVRVGAVVDAAKVPCGDRWHEAGTAHGERVTSKPNRGAASPLPMTWWRWVTSRSSGMRMSFTSSSSSGLRSSRQQDVALSRGTGEPPPTTPALAPVPAKRARVPTGPGLPATGSTAGTGGGRVRAGQAPSTPPPTGDHPLTQHLPVVDAGPLSGDGGIAAAGLHQQLQVLRPCGQRRDGCGVAWWGTRGQRGARRAWHSPLLFLQRQRSSTAARMQQTRKVTLVPRARLAARSSEAGGGSTQPSASQAPFTQIWASRGSVGTGWGTPRLGVAHPGGCLPPRGPRRGAGAGHGAGGTSPHSSTRWGGSPSPPPSW